MRAPSTIGVGDAQLFFGLMSRRSVGILKTSTLTTSLPVTASNASARSDTPLLPRAESRGCSIAVVIQTLPLTTTGDDQPSPATGVFHAMFFVSLHSRGKPCSAE